jgi:Tol biopolymer transport system component
MEYRYTRAAFAYPFLCFAPALLLSWPVPSSAADRPKDAEARYTIAFGSFAPIRTNVFIADSDGNNVRPVLRDADVDYNPSFSHDGGWILFTSQRGGSADLWRVRVDGSGLERLTADRAFDDQGAISPDGASVAFVSTRGGRANIWLLDLSSGKLKNLTPNSTGDFRPAWSPDGQWIAFSSDRDSTRPLNPLRVPIHSTEIYVMRRDGSDARRITRFAGTAGSPAWSPDGSEIVYYEATLQENFKVVNPARERGEMQVVVVNWRTGERRVLKEGSGEKWSPRWLSRSTVGYVSGGPSGGIDRTDGQPGERGEFWNANWSPDGNRMVFHRETDSSWPPFQEWPSLVEKFRLLRTGIFPSYSPAGDRLICNSARAGILHNSILIMSPDGSKQRVLFDDPQRSALAPVWSPQGHEVAFALGEFFQMIPGRERLISRLAVIRPDGAGLRVLATAGDHAGFPSWSPDGKRLVYRTSAKGDKGLRIIDLASERVTKLTNGPYTDNFPAWAPRGDRIAFVSDRNDDYEIYSIRPDGSGLKRLTRSPGNEGHLAWSPDGKWIAFASARTGFVDEALLHPYNGQPTGEIFVMRADGTNVKRLTENPFEDATPAWRPTADSSKHAAARRARDSVGLPEDQYHSVFR